MTHFEDLEDSLLSNIELALGILIGLGLRQDQLLWRRYVEVRQG